MNIIVRTAGRAFLGVLATLSVAVGARADGYTFSIFDYPGASATLLLGMTPAGTAAGFSWGFTNVNTISFTYDVRLKQVVPIAALPNTAETDVWNINEAGTTVGGAWSPDYSTEAAFIRDRDGNYTLLSPPGWANSEAQGINDKGVVTGHAFSADYSQYTAFIYDPGTRAYTFLMPSAYTLAHGINAHGDVVGLATLAAGAAYPGSPAGVYGWHRNARGATTLFRVNGMDTYVRAINDVGVMGGFVEDSTTGIDTGFLAHVPDDAHPGVVKVKATTLIHIPNEVSTPVEGVLNDGRVVGVALDAAGGLHGYVARPE